VFIHDTASTQTAKACTSRGAHQVHIAPADCCSMEVLDKMARTVLEQYGPVDILVSKQGSVGFLHFLS
jgi:NAD(P)-dependent dehydrogenase (short-subunit alcohol dehydrogenase family)